MRTLVFTMRMICLLLIGFMIGQPLYAARLTGNYNVKVTSSSQWSNWTAERIIDSNPRNDADNCQCCSATNHELDPWYQLDFGKNYRVRRVYIKGRKIPQYGQCADGEYGDTCNDVCHCNGDPCNKTTGVCPSGECLPGYHGQQCDKLCSNGTYGPGCKETCGNCLGHNIVCDKMTGKCPSSCSAGYKGDQCKTECIAGTYGLNCTRKCGKCLDNKPCNVTTGTCEHGCSDGFQDLKRDRECNKGRYGINCSKTCGYCTNNETCTFTNGACSNGCRAGYTGHECKTGELPSGMASCSVPTGVAIGGTAGTILLIEAFVGAVVYLIWKRRQGQSERRSHEEVNLYEMPDREAFTSEHPYELNQPSVTTTPTYENTERPQNNE